MELVTFWFGIAVVTGLVGSSRGRSGFGWFILGCLFSILALIVVLAKQSLKAVAGAATPETHVRCPDYRELAYKDARECKQCGTGLIAST